MSILLDNLNLLNVPIIVKNKDEWIVEQKKFKSSSFKCYWEK